MEKGMRRCGVAVAFWIWGKGDGVWSDGEEEKEERRKRMEVDGGEGWEAWWIGRQEGSSPFFNPELKLELSLSLLVIVGFRVLFKA